MRKADHFGLRTWVEVDTKAIRFNYKTFRGLVSKNVKIMGVVKSNAYGNNLTEFSLVLERLGVDMLAVDSVVEALALRMAGAKTGILVLGYTLPEMFAKVARKNIHLTISSVEALSVFLKTRSIGEIPIHIKVDTGMHRQGFLFSEMEEVLEMIAKTNINVAGLYTHFASAKDPKERAFTESQIREFEVWSDAFISVGLCPLVHTGATGGASYFPEAHFDMVRVGAGLYGFWPDDKKLSLKPVLSWKTIISEVKEIPEGHGIGYDLTHKVGNATRIAICPIGYWHGYPRILSSNAEVLVRGVRARVLGRVSMDMIVIDVTNIPRAKAGDEVVLIGKSAKEKITANELALLAGTSPYEILTRINPLIRRIYK